MGINIAERRTYRQVDFARLRQRHQSALFQRKSSVARRQRHSAGMA